jgi:hypothetical protein
VINSETSRLTNIRLAGYFGYAFPSIIFCPSCWSLVFEKHLHTDSSRKPMKYEIRPWANEKGRMMKRPITNMVFFTLSLLIPPFAWAQPVLNLIAVSSQPGGTPINPQITLADSSVTGITAIAMDIGYDTAKLTNPVAAIGSSGSNAGKLVLSSSPAAGVFRLGIISLTNSNLISDGVVASVKFDIKSGAAGSHIALSYKGSASDAKGRPVTLSGDTGSITVSPLPVCLVGSPATYYSRLVDAYGAISADNSEIQTLQGTLTEIFDLKNNYHLNLIGGFDSGFVDNTGNYTNISGIVVENGSLTVDHIVVQ